MCAYICTIYIVYVCIYAVYISVHIYIYALMLMNT